MQSETVSVAWKGGENDYADDTRDRRLLTDPYLLRLKFSSLIPNTITVPQELLFHTNQSLSSPGPVPLEASEVAPEQMEWAEPG